MEGKASEILEDLGKQYLDHLINNYDNKKITKEKSLNKKENKKIIKSFNKKKFLLKIIHVLKKEKNIIQN